MATPLFIQAAAIISARKFALAISDASFGSDPKTILMTYDGQYSQPWSRFDIPRFISAISVQAPDPSLGPSDCDYVALSENGELYYIGEGQSGGIVHETIPGTQADDPTRTTAFGTLRLHADFAVVAGREDVRIFNGLNWMPATPDLHEDPLYGAPVWACFPTSGEQTLLFCVLRPSMDQIWLKPGDPEWREDMQPEERLQIEQRRQIAFTQTNPKVLAGAIEKSSRFAWQTVQPRSIPQAAHVDGDTSWLVGADGMILHGSVAGGFRDVSFMGDRGFSLVGITRFGEDMVVLSDSSVHRFGGHMLEVFTPKVRLRNPPLALAPIQVDTRDGALILVDANLRVHVLRDGAWKEIPVPNEMLQ